MIFVTDTNLLISALLKPLGTPANALALAQQKGRICFSEKTSTEITEVLLRSKFDKYLPKEQRIKQLLHIFKYAEFVYDKTPSILACRDPKDNMFLELAVVAQAACIITGDKDLLELHPFRNIPILSPSDFILTY